MSPKKIEFNNGETVVYPKHGVGEIIKIESMEIASIKTMFYVVKMEQSKLTIRVPIEKQEEVGLRKISSKKIVNEVYEVLKLKPKINIKTSALIFLLFLVSISNIVFIGSASDIKKLNQKLFNQKKWVC